MSGVSPSSTLAELGGEVCAIGGRAAWRKADLVSNPYWGLTLSEDELDELHHSLLAASENDIEWEDDVPLNGRHARAIDHAPP